MPNCFQLTRKSELDKGPVKLDQIDQEMCDHFKEPCDPKKWYCWWYDIIGFKLAMGKTFDQIKDDLKSERDKAEENDIKQVNQKWLDITEWLDENFTSNAWYQVHK